MHFPRLVLTWGSREEPEGKAEMGKEGGGMGKRERHQSKPNRSESPQEPP